MAPRSPIQHMPQPAIILDKSAFQALSRDEHAQRLFRYQENITPILLHEILADLAKTQPDKSPEAAVQILAGKFIGSGGVINADHRTLCVGNLTGAGTSRLMADRCSTSTRLPESRMALWRSSSRRPRPTRPSSGGRQGSSPPQSEAGR